MNLCDKFLINDSILKIIKIHFYYIFFLHQKIIENSLLDIANRRQKLLLNNVVRLLNAFEFVKILSFPIRKHDNIIMFLFSN